jgi:hypothetical protein
LVSYTIWFLHCYQSKLDCYVLLLSNMKQVKRKLVIKCLHCIQYGSFNAISLNYTVMCCCYQIYYRYQTVWWWSLLVYTIQFLPCKITLIYAAAIEYDTGIKTLGGDLFYVLWSEILTTHNYWSMLIINPAMIQTWKLELPIYSSNLFDKWHFHVSPALLIT